MLYETNAYLLQRRFGGVSDNYAVCLDNGIEIICDVHIAFITVKTISGLMQPFTVSLM